MVIVPHPPSHKVRHPPPKAVGILVQQFVFYSIAHACSNSYVPVASVYDTPTGAYIMHEPPGLDARQLVAVPADVWPDGHELLATVI